MMKLQTSEQKEQDLFPWFWENLKGYMYVLTVEDIDKESWYQATIWDSRLCGQYFT